MEALPRRSDPFLNYELHRQKALQERHAYLKASLPSISPKTKHRVGLFATAVIVATGAFWATMLTSPPVSEAANQGFSIHELHLKAPLDLPTTEADAI